MGARVCEEKDRNHAQNREKRDHVLRLEDGVRSSIRSYIQRRTEKGAQEKAYEHRLVRRKLRLKIGELSELEDVERNLLDHLTRTRQHHTTLMQHLQYAFSPQLGVDLDSQASAGINSELKSELKSFLPPALCSAFGVKHHRPQPCLYQYKSQVEYEHQNGNDNGNDNGNENDNNRRGQNENEHEGNDEQGSSAAHRFVIPTLSRRYGPIPILASKSRPRPRPNLSYGV